MKHLLAVFLIAIILGLGAHPVHAQRAGKLRSADAEKLNQAEDTLALLAYTIINDSIQENRFAACRTLITCLVRNLKTPNSFRYNFPRMTAVSIQYPADSSFRVFTWQLYVDDNEYRYYGAIQMNTSDLQLFPLVDRSHEMNDLDLEQARLTADRWYGAVYYNLKTTQTPQGPAYLLFGYDGYSFFRRRKLIDVLTFSNGQPVFGAPIFHHEPENRPAFTRNRVMLEYSAESSMRCNYDESLGIIVFDHLTVMAGQYNEGPTNVPDGTYEGYEWKDRRWKYIEQLPTQVLDAAPLPNPVLKERPKDILGRQN